jgi:hypothetical protein
MIEHSPTPWKIDDGILRDANGKYIMRAMPIGCRITDQREADHTYGLRCVNTRDELVAALADIVNMIEAAASRNLNGGISTTCITMIKARAALAKAKGEDAPKARRKISEMPPCDITGGIDSVEYVRAIREGRDPHVKGEGHD